MHFIVEVKNNGRLQLPKELRETLNLSDGSKLTLELESGFLKVMTTEQRLEEARAILRQNQAAWEALTVDDFIADRRLAARRETEE